MSDDAPPPADTTPATTALVAKPRPDGSYSKTSGDGQLPSKYTPEIHARIVAYIQDGSYVETAAAAAGICKKTLYFWLRRGARLKDGPLYQFVKDVDVAMAQAEHDSVSRVRKAGLISWQAEAWWLERTRPQKFRRREQIEHTGPDGKPLDFTKRPRSPREMTTKERTKRIAELQAKLEAARAAADAATKAKKPPPETPPAAT